MNVIYELKTDEKFENFGYKNAPCFDDNIRDFVAHKTYRKDQNGNWSTLKKKTDLVTVWTHQTQLGRRKNTSKRKLLRSRRYWEQSVWQTWIVRRFYRPRLIHSMTSSMTMTPVTYLHIVHLPRLSNNLNNITILL